ncbi:MAG TPA: hypothetical protein VGH98_18295 [Gemmatimonadaceae bacterium]|jgi:hypothetical protein
MSHGRVLRLATLTIATIWVSYGRGAPDESMVVLRAQIELSVCDAPDAGTTDPVAATLANDIEGELTWLDGPGRNFGRGNRYTYDLSLESVHTLADVADLRVSKSGNDALCLRELRLIVNQKPIFVRTFPDGVWLNATTRNELRSTRAELRTNAAWQAYTWSLSEWIASTGGAIARPELVQRLQTCVAKAMHDLQVAWKPGMPDAIHLRRRNDSTISATVALVRPREHWVDGEMVLAFDLSLCTGGRAEPTITGVALRDATPWYAFMPSGNRPASDQQTLTMLRSRLTHSRPLMMAAGLCPHVDANANIIY